MNAEPFAAPRWMHRTGIVVLLFAVAWTYSPALAHPPREDQWPFLVDTYDKDHFVPLILNTYSYNRTREVLPGDYPLFRPGLFALLCAEKALFGPHYAYWQAFGIALHLAIVFALLRLLLRLESMFPCAAPGVRGVRVGLAYLVALFFGVNFAGAEMVIWCHIHGYMLYALLILGGLLLVLDDLCGDGAAPGRAWRIGGAFLLTLFAAFTYETGSVYALVLGSALALGWFRRGEFRQGIAVAGLFASILVVYRGADWLDQRSHPDTKPDITAATVFDHAFEKATVQHAVRYALFTLGQPFFPAVPRLEVSSRLQIQEPLAIRERYARLRPQHLVSFAVVGLAGFLGLCGLARLVAGRLAFRALPLVAVLVGLFGLHMAVIVLGRMNLRPGPTVLASNSYYAYVPLCLLLVGLYYLWVRLPPLRAGWSCAVLFLLGGGLATVSLCSAQKVHALNTRMAARMRPLANQIDAAQGVIDRHGHEPGFALSFDPPLLDALETCHGLTLMELLFFCRFNHQRPTHVLCGSPDCLYAMTAREYEARRGDALYRLIPKLVRKGTHFMVYEYRGRYFATQTNKGRFSRARDGFGELLEGDSLDAVMQTISARLRNP